MNELRPDRDDGFSLIEILVSMVIIVALIGGATIALVASMRASDNSQLQTRESNDAQIISNYLVRDAQAAGGSSPVSGAVNTSLGVSNTAALACAASSGALVLSLRWNDLTGATAVSNVANYYTDANMLIRRTCVGSATPVDLPLARHVLSATATCDPGCAPLPRSISLTVTSTNAQGAGTPYSYTLLAAVRPESQVAPTGTNNGLPSPLIALGSACPAITISGNTNVTVNGGVLVNGTDAGSCTAMSRTGISTFGAGSVQIAPGGSCAGCSPAATALPAPVADPFANAVPPAHTCGVGGSNPAQVAGVWQPGTYHAAVSLGSGLQQFAPGIYTFCAGLGVGAQSIVRGTGVMFYFHGGTITINGGADVQLSPGAAIQLTAEGPAYTGLLLWQDHANNTSPMTLAGNATVNTFAGVVYAPSATVALSGTAGSGVGSIIARQITFSGTGGSGIYVGPPPSLAISGPATLPAGTVNVAYAATTVTAVGGTLPRTFSATGLPAGMNIAAATGVISGTPTASGPFAVIVTVTDSAATPATATASYALTIGAAVPPPVPTNVVLANNSGQAAVGDTVTITFSEPMSGTSFCATLPANGIISGNNEITVTIADGPAGDVLSVTSTTCALNFGQIGLNANYVGTAGATFRGSGNQNNRSTLTWNAAAQTLTIRLGAMLNGGQPLTVAAAVAPTYTPSPAITSATGVAINPAAFTAPAASRF